MLALSYPPIIEDHLSLFIAGLIVVVGLLIIGFKDTFHFSLKRVLAIASVCRAESVRKKVLLIAPLAMLGVVIVSQLQKPFDEQDAIRQTTKFCLFATGLVVAITAVILACTNLPKEIENRVIYTVVTKPTTRLEIVAGKVVGFAQVSFLILLIMGLFTYGYLWVRAWSLEHDIAIRLEKNAVDPVSRPTLQHYRDAGLLNAKRRVEASELQMYSRAPVPGDTTRWMGNDQDLIVPFAINPADMIAPGDPSETPGITGMVLVVRLTYTQRAPTSQEWETMPEARQAATQPVIPTSQLPEMIRATTAPIVPKPAVLDRTKLPTPQITINILDNYRNVIVDARSINNGKPIALPPPDAANRSRGVMIPQEASMQIASRLAQMPPEDRKIYVQVAGITPGVQYGADEVPLKIAMLGTTPGTMGKPFAPAARAMFRGRLGTFGQQLKGAEGDNAPVAVYTFRNAPLDTAADIIPLEIRLGIERNTSTSDTDRDNPTQLAIEIRNNDTGKIAKQLSFTPETNRTSYLRIAREDVAGGNVDVIVRCLTPEQWIGLRSSSVVLVPSQEAFSLNLGKSLLILWLMSILVTIISIFCSTFLSWPIAIILTLVLLLGHWGVTQLGDATAPGIGNQVANDLFKGSQAAAKMKVVSSSVEALAKFLNVISKVLPDVSQFSATEDIERGVVIPPARLIDALQVVVGFGLPLGVLAYVFLKYKEVAP